MARIVVVLPAPLGPRNPVTEPGLDGERHPVERTDRSVGPDETFDLQHASDPIDAIADDRSRTGCRERSHGSACDDPGMTDRVLTVGAAQLGPIQRDDTRKEVVERLLTLLHEAHERRCDLVVFPELALTTFFPRWFTDDIGEFDHFYETAMPGPETQPLFDEARRLGIGFALGYAELTEPDAAGVRHRYNTQILVERDGSVVARYRKVHLPGHEEHEPDRPFQHAERYFFEPGPEGFGVWRAFGGNVGMMTCNDRRWPESYRVMGLQAVELILCGYNTPIHYAPDPSQDVLQGFHNAPRDAVRRLPERHVGGRRGQGRRRGGRRLAGPVDDRGAVGPDRRPGPDDRRRAGRGPLRPRLVRPLPGHGVRLRPLPPARDVHPHHGPAGGHPARLTAFCHVETSFDRM